MLVDKVDDKDTQQLKMINSASISLSKDMEGSPMVRTISFSVKDRSTRKVNSPVVLRSKRFQQAMKECVKNLFAPSLSCNNIRLFGSKKLVLMEIERSKASGKICERTLNYRNLF